MTRAYEGGQCFVRELVVWAENLLVWSHLESYKASTALVVSSLSLVTHDIVLQPSAIPYFYSGQTLRQYPVILLLHSTTVRSLEAVAGHPLIISQ